MVADFDFFFEIYVHKTSNKFTVQHLKKKKELYDPFLWMGFNCFKVTEPLRGAGLLFTIKFSEIPGTRLINLGRIKGLVDVEAELTMFIEKIVFRHIFTKVVGTVNVFENFIKNFLREQYCSCVFH